MSADRRPINTPALVYFMVQNRVHHPQRDPSKTAISSFSPRRHRFHQSALLSSLPACEKDVQKVCANSSEENLQPFKDKMESFISTGESAAVGFLEKTPT